MHPNEDQIRSEELQIAQSKEKEKKLQIRQKEMLVSILF